MAVVVLHTEQGASLTQGTLDYTRHRVTKCVAKVAYGCL